MATSFSRDACYRRIMQLLSNHTVSPNSDLFFRDRPSSSPYNGPSNMTLTLRGCDVLCGPKQSWYNDIGPRLVVWLLPVLLLLANVQLSPLGRHSFLPILHLLGDPIDSMWSLIHKLDAWKRCAELAAQAVDACESCQSSIALVLATYDEVQGPSIDSERHLELLLQNSNPITHISEWRRAAIRLADSRTDELGRAVVAFLVYIFGIVGAFVAQIGGTPSSPPGGRIATGLLLSWLVPVMFLSNLIGGLPAPRIAYDILSELFSRTGVDAFHVDDQTSVSSLKVFSESRTSHAGYLDAFGWAGGNFIFRPWKLRYITRTHSRRLYTFWLFMLADAPIIFCSVGGGLILWYQHPYGPNCRHSWLIGITVLWHISAWLTAATYRPSFATGVYHWRITLVKDGLVALPSILILFLSAAGLFNFCWCWSGPVTYRGKGRVLVLSSGFIQNDATVYPAIVGVVLLLQTIMVIVIAIIWRRGLMLLRWSEKRRRLEWNRSQGKESCGCLGGHRRTHS